ncbi:MAG: hypothetical protein DMF61_18930 [Blastocatellia bacterium AA13]|nr:MAG: hypothetical protein DMF61_18930 [Blastocatellia bacterium AA13]
MKKAILILLLLLTAGSAGCKKSASGGGGSSSSAKNPLDLFTNAISGWENVKSFRAHMTSTGLPTGSTETRMEAVMPDRFHITTDRSEMVLIGQTTYLKLPTGEWRKITTGLDNSFGSMRRMMEDLKGSKEVQMIGSETLDGTQTSIYESKLTMPSMSGSKDAAPQVFLAKIWVAASDGMPRRVESSSSGSPVRTVITYTDYNANIKIDPPID